MEKDKLCIQKINTVLAALVAVLIYFFVLVRYDLYYEMNDDSTIRNILSGAYSGAPSALNNQMLYPISILISFLYGICSKVGWFDLLLIISQFVCIFLILKTVLEYFERTASKIAASVIFALFAAVFILEYLVLTTYTITSGMLAVTAVFVFVADKETEITKKSCICIILSVVSCCIRSEMLLMMLPFIALAGLYCWSIEDKIFTAANFKKYFGIISALLVSLAALFAVDHFAYSKDEWQQYRNFFDARTTVYDYTDIPDYDDNPDFYQVNNISYEEYLLFTTYNYVLDDDINADVMEDMAEYAQSIQTDTFKRVRRAFSIYRKNLVNDIGTPYHTLIAAGYLLLLLSVTKKSFIRISLTAGTTFFTRTVIWTYLLFKGRTPERIISPLYWVEFALLLAIFLKEIYKSTDRKKMTANAIASILIIYVCATSFTEKNSLLNSRYNAIVERSEKLETVQSYCNENEGNFYLLTVLSMGVYPEKVFDGNSEPVNADLLGGWAVKSPLHKEKLLRYGIDSAEDALIYNDNVYIIQKSDHIEERTDYPFKWLIRHYERKGKKVEVLKADTIVDNIEVYKVHLIE